MQKINFYLQLSMQLSHLSITQRRRNNNKRAKKNNKMTWKESNEFIKKIDKLESQKKCYHISEQKIELLLHLHNHFAN